MKLTALVAPTFVALLAHAQTQKVKYDSVYDDPNGSLETVACSDGVNGLITRHFGYTFGVLPRFDHIGAASAIEGWNSESCGTCWQLNYTTKFIQKSIIIFAMDTTKEGFTISKAAMDDLTDDQASALGQVDVKAQEAPCA